MTHKFFLGSKSADGFHSDFSKIIKKDQYYTYILKGGPGTGKSTLMKKIASEFINEDHELYFCSSDPSSLDAVVLSDRRIIITDGTSPHPADPEYPCVLQQIVDLGAAVKKEKIRKYKEKIIELTDLNRLYQTRAGRYIQAGTSLNQNSFSISSAALNYDKTEKFIQKITKDLFRSKGNKSENSFRTLSAFTASGYYTMPLPDEYSITVIKDPDIAAADMIIRKTAEKAAEWNYECHISLCPAYSGEICEHLIIPELKKAFITSDHISRIDTAEIQTVNAGRFYNKKLLNDKKIFSSFNKKVVSSIISEVSLSMKNALDIHNELEKYYIESLDTSLLNEISEKMISEIRNNEC